MTQKEENANKRLIFYFTSRILFMIIAIIIISSWCCMFVHADEITDDYGSNFDNSFDITDNNGTIKFTTVNSYLGLDENEDYYLCYDTVDSYYTEQGYSSSDKFYQSVSDYSSMYNNLNYIGRTEFIETMGISSVPIPYSVEYNGYSANLSDYYVCCSIFNNNYYGLTMSFYFMPKDYYDSHNLFIFNGSIKNPSSLNNSSWEGESGGFGFRFFYNSGNFSIDNFGAYSNSRTFAKSAFSTFPRMLGCSSLDEAAIQNYNVYLSGDSSTSVFENNVAYYTYSDIISSGSSPEILESSKNHLFLKDFQIGLTGSDSGIDIVQSSLICGVSCGDTWQQNNINDFNLKVTVSIGCSTSSVNVPDFIGSEQYVYPLATFTNNVFNYSVYDIFRDIDSTGVGNFLNYYNTYLKPTTQTIAIRNYPYENYTGLFPTIVNNAYKYLVGSYKYEQVVTEEAPQIDDLSMSVTINLVDNKGNISGSGTKVFNFLNGSTSVTNADILHNNDPWEGEATSPDVDPNIPSTGIANSSGNGATAIAYGGNTTVNVNNSNGFVNNVVNNQDPEQVDDTIGKYLGAMNTFQESIGSMSSIGSQGGFLSILTDTYSFIPGLSYIAISCGVIFGLCIILFIIKVLLF